MSVVALRDDLSRRERQALVRGRRVSTGEPGEGSLGTHVAEAGEMRATVPITFPPCHLPAFLSQSLPVHQSQPSES